MKVDFYKMIKYNEKNFWVHTVTYQAIIINNYCRKLSASEINTITM